MMNPSVSVVISTYNGASFIGETVSAIFAQTIAPDEVLIVDDCSTDHIETVVAAIARQASTPIRFARLPQRTGSPSKPLNVGISNAKGEFILTLDQDDLMRPRRVEASLKALLAFPKSSFATGRFSVLGFDEGDTKKLWPTSQFSDISDYIDPAAEFSLLDSKVAFAALLLKNFAVSTSNFCFTKLLWERIGGFDEMVRTCSDLDFILRAAQVVPIVIINETIFEYRWRGDSLHRRSTNESELEATMVRLRASSKTPEWAGEHLRELRYSAMSLAGAKLKSGNLSAVSDVVEVLSRHKGFSVIRRSLWNRTPGSKRRKGKHLASSK